MGRELLRKLPKVDELLKRQSLTVLLDRLPRELVVDTVREVLDSRRQALLDGNDDEKLVTSERIEAEVNARVEARLTPGLRSVINATGVVLHTNLGRAPLGRHFLEAAVDVAAGYSNLEYDLGARKRGSRYVHTADLLQRLTGAEASLVVNNNAAAMVVMLAALSNKQEAIVSRGELIEIGGSFRLPEIFEASGAVLKEIGTTNRTHLHDYDTAVGPNTGIILKVHRSNFAIVGFTNDVPAEDLAELGKSKNIPVCEDLGSGCLVDLSPYGIDCVTVGGQVAKGLDLVTFSGDKLLGGPQAGIIVGKKSLVDRIRKHPFTRALRVDKLTLATLERTLISYLDGSWRSAVPILKMLTLSSDELLLQAQALSAAFSSRLGDLAEISIVASEGQVGGGALPETVLPSHAVCVSPKSGSNNRIEAALRRGECPVICRVNDTGLLFDVRTVLADQHSLLVSCVASIIAP